MTDRLLTIAEIAQIADVRPTAVHNWRRRISDFPLPDPSSIKGNEYNEIEVLQWLREHRPNLRLSDLNLAIRRSLDVIAGLGAAPALLVYATVLEQIQAMIDQKDGTSLDALRTSMCDQKGPSTELLQTFDEETFSTLASMLTERSTELVLVDIADEINQLTRRGGARHFTTHALRDLLVELVGPIHGSVLDPCAGSGGLLRAAALASQDSVQLWAADADDTIGAAFSDYAACRSDLTFQQSDVLTNDPFAGMIFDRILIDPPFSLQSATGSALRNGELAWVNYAQDHLSADGSAAIVTPHRHLVRPSDALKRQNLLREGALSAIVSLPAIGSHKNVPLAIWVLSGDTSQDSVVFVDASELSAANWVDDHGFDLVIDAFVQARASEPSTLYVGPTGSVSSVKVPVSVIRSADANLLPARWVSHGDQYSKEDSTRLLNEIVDGLQTAAAEIQGLCADLPKVLMEGPEPEMVRWSSLEGSALFTFEGMRTVRGDDKPAHLVSKLSTELGPPAQSGLEGTTSPGDVLFSPHTPVTRMAVVDKTGGHLIERPLVRIQVDHPEGRITPEILAAWLNSIDIVRQALAVAPSLLDLQTLDVPLFTREQAEQLTIALRSARDTSEALSAAASVGLSLGKSLMQAAMTGVTVTKRDQAT